MGGASHNGRKDQLTTHGIFRDALAAREIRLNCRQMEFACLKNCRFQTVYTTHGYNDSVHALKDIFKRRQKCATESFEIAFCSRRVP